MELVGCLGSRDLPPPADESERRLVWDFEHIVQRETSMSLWPPSAHAPSRIKRHLLTTKKDEALRARVAGADPGFIWQFGEPTAAGSFHVEMTTAAPTTVQLFWAGTTCRSFSERCSMHLPIDAGRSAVGAALPPERLSELRLDFEQRTGVQVDIHSITLGSSIVHDGAWSAPFDGTSVLRESSGLVVESSHDDPWITTDLPELPASLSSAVTIVMDAPAGSVARVFWRGSECPMFAEACAAPFAPTTGGLTATSVDVEAVATWNGTLSGLRIDPGTRAARYVLTQIVLEPATR